MSNLQIFSNSIRQIDNLYSLTDLHKASGGNEKHKPVLFLRLDQTKDLISEIENDKVQICTLAVKTVRGGTNPSTYACMEIALAYAAWIDPKFHLIVLRAYMAMKGNSQNSAQIAPLVEPTIHLSLTQTELRDLINTWMLFTRFAESVHPLLNKIRGIVQGNLYSLPEFNLNRCDISIRETHPIILKLLAALPKEQPLHNSRKQIKHF